jgi:eukaryotic-like serine/threonine-protein kinase
MIGKTISHYQIIEKLGGGGMGVVYKAKDTKLDRFVALKFLPPHLSVDEEAKQRFIAEAKAASALDHPNIAVIYEIGETEDGELFIVMAFYDGETLKKKIANGKATPVGLQVAEAADIATQIARGLARAHEAGITHRDIKPANIMVTNRGEVKIVDFGLAKMAHVDLTKPGSTLGTAAYMSPEQARGEPVDHRTDIWAFGVVLYEMLTGQLPFHGVYEQAVIYSILNEEPHLDEIPDAAMRAVAKKCLEKDRDRRYETIADLLKDLQIDKQISGEKAQTAKNEVRQKVVRPYLPKTVFGLAGVVLLLVVYFVFFHSKEQAENLPPMKTTRLTSYPGEEYFPSFSPDGKSVAFSWNGPQQDNFDIYVKLVGAGNPVRLTTNALADIRPEWSRDGSYIAFVREVEYQPEVPPKEIYIIPALGGREQKIVGFHPGLDARPSISWSYDNKFIYYPGWSVEDNGFLIYKVSIETHKIEQVTTLPKGEFGDQSPRVSPNGKYVAFLRGQQPGKFDIFVQNSENNKVQRMTQIDKWIDGFSWGNDSRSILFASNLDGTSALWKAGFSNEKLKKVTSGIDINNPYLSVQGNRLVYAETIVNTNIWKIDLRNPDRETLLIGSSNLNFNPDISPDGTKILFTSNRTGTYNIWMCDINGENQSQLTFFEDKTTPSEGATWSPSGSKILIGFNIYYIMDATGGTPAEISNNMGFTSWNKDGSGYYGSPSRQWNIYSLTKNGKIQQQITHEGGLMPHVFENYIYYVKSWNYHDIWRIPIQGGAEEPVLQGVTDMGMTSWAVVKNGTYFIRDNGGSPVLEFYNFGTKTISHIKDVPMANPELFSPIEIDPDERYLLYSKSEPNKSDIILVENFRVE